MRKQRGNVRSASSAPAAVGQRIELTLDRLTHDGRGIGSWQGRTVFVEGGLPGERVSARVTRARSKLIESRLETVIDPSTERRTPACRHAELCGGCNLQHMPREAQLALKQQALAQQLQHFAGVQPQDWMPALVGDEYAYRERARLSVRWLPQERHLQVGYRQRTSQKLVDVEECPILVPVLEKLLSALPEVLRKLSDPHSLGHVELIGGVHPSMVIRHMRPLTPEDIVLLTDLAQQHGVVCRLQSGAGAVMHSLPDNAPDPAYQLIDQDLLFQFSAGDFTQVNAQINAQMIEQALSWLAVKPGEKVLDLFCGIGNFSLPLARQGAEVTGVEGSLAMVERAQQNAKLNNLENLHFCAADLSKPEATDWLKGSYQAALLDPPRDGAAELVAVLARKRLSRILYVSCNPATLARDAGILAQAGYRMVQVGIMDMFPQTAHVEAMALFMPGKDKK